jgi:hypothetical protein
MMLAELIADGEVRLLDGTLIACANYPGCASLSEFAGHASYGYCPSKSLFVWGMRLVLISNAKGVPVGYDLTGPKTGQERKRALELAAAHAGSTLFADILVGRVERRSGLLGQRRLGEPRVRVQPRRLAEYARRLLPNLTPLSDR